VCDARQKNVLPEELQKAAQAPLRQMLELS
jgi:hypothetical protein